MPSLTEDLQNQEISDSVACDSNGFSSSCLNSNYPADMRSAERRSSDDEKASSDQDEHYVKHMIANPYPPTQPFINDDFRRSPHAPCKTTPTNNRQAVMSALRSLQDKIRQLELERSDAEDNIRVLHDDTDKYKDILRHSIESPTVPKYAPHSVSTSSEANVNAKLETAEHRCNVLEKQLDDMRDLARAAEEGRASVLRKTKLLQEDQEGKEQDQLRQYKTDISELRREYLKLTASQTLTKDKITDIEQQLNEEKVLRKCMRDRTAQLETAAEANKILQELALSSKPKKAKKKKKKVSMQKSADKRRRPGMEPAEHYKLNLKAIPFTAGKSTSPSHSLTANFQEVLSLMKAHNPKLCQSPRTARHIPKHRASSRSHSAHDPDLTGLLLQLQDEFGHLTFEHQELMHQLQETADPSLHEDLERELDAVVAKMENKGEQIARLRRHQDMMLEKRRKKKQASGTSTSVPGCYNGEVEVTTTVRTKGSATGNLVVRPSSASCAQASLNLLKNLKKIKSTLQKDDLTWDCC